MYCRVLSWMSTDVSEVRAASIIRTVSHRPDDGGSTHLRNVGRHPIKTRQYIPEDSELHTRRRENFKSNIFITLNGTLKSKHETDAYEGIILVLAYRYECIKQTRPVKRDYAVPCHRRFIYLTNITSVCTTD
jgi:hypothetical protein